MRQKLLAGSFSTSLANNETAVRAVQDSVCQLATIQASPEVNTRRGCCIVQFVGLRLCNFNGIASQMGAVLGHFEQCPLLRCWPCFDPFSFRRCRRGVCAAKTDDVTAWGDPTESCRHQNRSPTRRTTHASAAEGRVRSLGSATLWGLVKHFAAQRLANSKRTELGTHSLRGCVEVPIYVFLPLWFIRRAAFRAVF